ncbi:MAG: YiiX/YebB-like N1pC/P60 family cysteine hydrolase [Melioribacteraceae bacterium]|nr:YiiX/YebB-like N1pC/P60 family cysteine hydrolase [Melioribacteraceae bacterium]
MIKKLPILMCRDNKLTKTSCWLILIFAALFIPKTFDVRDVVQATTYSSLDIDSDILCEGDIIFRRGISLISNMVLEADASSPYSHVGIIIFDSLQPFVVHAVPDESESGIDYIKKDSLNQFLRKDRASAYAVYRHYDRTASRLAAKISEGYYKKKILFDSAFDLFDSKELYCTELVWKAYKEVNVDITNNVFDTLTIPLGKNPYLLPGTLLRSSRLTKITNVSFYQ